MGARSSTTRPSFLWGINERRFGTWCWAVRRWWARPTSASSWQEAEQIDPAVATMLGIDPTTGAISGTSAKFSLAGPIPAGSNPTVPFLEARYRKLRLRNGPAGPRHRPKGPNHRAVRVRPVHEGSGFRAVAAGGVHGRHILDRGPKRAGARDTHFLAAAGQRFSLELFARGVHPRTFTGGRESDGFWSRAAVRAHAGRNSGHRRAEWIQHW